jgi:hypothetical protein
MDVRAMNVFVTAVAGFGPGGAGLEVTPGCVPDETLASGLTLRGLRPLSRAARLAMAAAAQVLPPGSPAGERDAVVLGSAWASVDPLADFVRVAAREGEDRVFPMAFPNTVVSVHAGYVGSLLGLTGPVLAPCGPHAGLEAVLEAVRLLAHGRADRVLAVGAEASGGVVAAASPSTGEAAAALRLSRTREADGCRAVITRCWTAARSEDLPPEVGDGEVWVEEDPPCPGAASGALAVARAVDRVATGGSTLTVVGRAGVRGVAAVRVTPPPSA